MLRRRTWWHASACFRHSSRSLPFPSTSCAASSQGPSSGSSEATQWQQVSSKVCFASARDVYSPVYCSDVDAWCLLLLRHILRLREAFGAVALAREDAGVRGQGQEQEGAHAHVRAHHEAHASVSNHIHQLRFAAGWSTLPCFCTR